MTHQDTPADCAHRWSYTGVRFRDGNYPRPGSSARTRYYGHHMMCVKCGIGRIEPIDTLDENTMQPIKFGATPAGKEEFPIEDERQTGVHWRR